MSATLPELHGWDGPWKGLKVLVTGLGVTGFSAADTLAELGAEVIVVDGSETEKKRMDAATLQIVGVADIRFGTEHTENLPEGLDLIVTSPGWRPDSALISAATAAGIPVWSDIQLARRLGPRPGARNPEWLVLTGTNGKTTTVTLLEQMLIAAGRRAVACGNIGMPILDAIRDPEGFDALAVELSSFQLHYTEAPGEYETAPLAAAVLNLAEDHVDWHGSQEEYAAAKARIYEGTRIACVYNVEDPTTENMVAEADVAEGCRAIGFTTGVPDVSMLGVVDTEEGDALLIDRAYLDNRRNQALELAARSDFGPLAPAHLVANALAAAALARAADVPPEAVKQAVADYQAADHRIQPVAKADDVLWVNDTKATNPHAAAASLAAFTDVVWIAGGLPKGVDYTDLVQQSGHRLRHVILIGTDSSQLRSSLERHAPQVPITEVATGDDGQRVMREAVAAAEAVAQPGQTVLLAPAAASMDQFLSYQERGTAFIEAVAELMQRKGFTT